MNRRKVPVASFNDAFHKNIGNCIFLVEILKISFCKISMIEIKSSGIKHIIK